jgi:hypothetical protein
LDFDDLIVATNSYAEEIIAQLTVLGIPVNKIKVPDFNKTRVEWVRSFASYVYEQNIPGNTVEAGVFRGEFAKYINTAFYDRKLYLFDTFEGFVDSDKTYEQNTSLVDFDFKNTSPELILNKMQYKDNCIIKKGVFPITTKDINDSFCFVSLDMDLFKPMLEGMCFFWKRMVNNGVILVHDYYSYDFPNVRNAVMEFKKQIHGKVTAVPIGDACSLAIIK